MKKLLLKLSLLCVSLLNQGNSVALTDAEIESEFSKKQNIGPVYIVHSYYSNHCLCNSEFNMQLRNESRDSLWHLVPARDNKFTIVNLNHQYLSYDTTKTTKFSTTIDQTELSLWDIDYSILIPEPEPFIQHSTYIKDSELMRSINQLDIDLKHRINDATSYIISPRFYKIGNRHTELGVFRFLSINESIMILGCYIKHRFNGEHYFILSKFENSQKFTYLLDMGEYRRAFDFANAQNSVMWQHQVTVRLKKEINTLTLRSTLLQDEILEAQITTLIDSFSDVTEIHSELTILFNTTKQKATARRNSLLANPQVSVLAGSLQQDFINLMFGDFK